MKNKTLNRIKAAFQLVFLFIFLGIFLNLAFVLALPLVIISIPWYIVNGKGILKFFEEQTLKK